MKKLLYFIVIAVIINTLSTNLLIAQDFYMKANGDTSFTTCNGFFYDDGGPLSNFTGFTDDTVTFYPGGPGKIRLSFSNFNVGDYASLTIYDGPDTSSMYLIGTYISTVSPGEVIATNASGALTLVFSSYATPSPSDSGWIASVSCDAGGPMINVMVNYNNLSCHNLYWNGILTNNSSSIYMSPQYENKWILDDTTVYGFMLPGSIMVKGYGNHLFTYIVTDTTTYTEVGRQEGSFWTEPIKIKSTVGEQACIGEEISLYINASVSYVYWNFGDSSTFEGSSYINHIYNSPGTYTVVASFQDACAFYDTASINIIVSNSAIPKPEININGGHTFCPGENITFSSEGKFNSFEWDFGDGYTDVGNKVFHAYLAAGTYPVKLRVKNKCGNYGESADTINIQNNMPAFADFGYNNIFNSSCSVMPIQFNSYSTGSTFNWDFGDTTYSTEPNPVHIYSSPGEYTVMLNVLNACGNDSTVQKLVNASPGSVMPLNVSMYPQMDFKDGPPKNDTIILCPGKSVFFRNNSQIFEPVNFDWYVNDTYFSSDQGSFELFADTVGNLTVKLVAITQQCGTTDSAKWTVIYTDTIKPLAELGVFPLRVCPGEKVIFFDNKFGNDKSYVYTVGFSDGDTLYNITTVEDTVLYSLASRNMFESVYFTYKVTNGCNQSISVSDSIIVTTDKNNVPYYYVSNSTIPYEGSRDFSKKQLPSDMGVNITVSVPGWTGGDTSTFYLFLWPKQVDLTKQPSGIVSFKGVNIASGTTVKAYVQYDPLMMNSFGVAAGYYCDNRMALQDQPDFYNMPAQQLYPFIAGGDTTINDTIILPTPNCDPMSIKGYWNGIYNSQPVLVNFNSDGKYRIDYVNNSTISQGTYTNIGTNLYSLVDSTNCMYTGTYTLYANADTLYGDSLMDNCTDRTNVLTKVKLLKGNPYDKRDNSVCVGDYVQFQISGGASYEWNFGDGATSADVYPIHAYNAQGDYNAFVKITTACGRTDTVYTPVKVSNTKLPKSNIKLDNSNVNAGQSVYFRTEDNSGGGFTSDKYKWYADGIFISAAKYASYTFSMPGQHYISLVTSNGCGSDSATQMVYVNQTSGCFAAFVINKINDSTFFFEAAYKGAYNYYWEYEDVSLNTVNAIDQHTFTGIGEHYVTLTVTLPDSSWCSYTGVVIISNPSCDVDFIATTMENRTVQFDAYSYNPYDYVNSWLWDFGDGNVGNGQVTTHIYSQIGYYPVKLIAEGPKCKSEILSWAYAQGNPCDTPVFTKSIITDTTYEFMIANPKSGVEYNWSFGDGTANDTGKIVTHKFTYDGIFYVWVSSYDSANWCSEYYSDTVKIGSIGCWSYFSFANDSDNHVNFYNYSSTGEYYWDFGDGKFSREMDPEHTYTNPGLYIVCLIVNDSTSNCTNKVCYEVKVGAVNCRADFSYTFDITGKEVKFQNLSTGNPNSFYWDFDDWNSSNLENPVHLYTDPGVYNVYLSIYNDLTGCFSEIYKKVQILDTIKPLNYTDFNWFIEEDNQTVHFINKSSPNITNWYWTFGDGSFKADTNIVHFYTKPGLYQVCLKVFDSNTGYSGTKCAQIMIGVATCSVEAKFAYMLDNANKTVKFTNKSTGDYDSYYWDFGDGNVSSEANPSHTYTSPGFYLVSIAVKKSGTSCIDYFADFLQIGQVDCKADFDYTVNQTTNEVTFTNNSNGNAVYYYWYFDDGEYSVEPEPIHKFNREGMHYVSLTISDSSGLCMDFTERKIQVGDVNCSAQFSCYIDIPSLTVSCNNEAIGEATEYYWYFGDGTVVADTNPVHKFKYPGYYTIGLNTFNSLNWCMDYYEVPVLVGSEGIDCQADFFYKLDTANNEVKFIDNSKGSILKYLWDFNDRGILSTDTNPSHIFDHVGFYNVCLSVINDKGVPNIACKWINVNADDKTNCLAKFNYTVDTVNRTVSLVSQSLGEPNKFKWDFGDGNTSIENDSATTHEYLSAGYYLVSLDISTPKNCANKSYQLININKPAGLVAGFGYETKDYSQKAGGYPVDFVGAGLGDQGKLRWSFGDGESDTTSTTPRHYYDTTGVYYVCLTYSDSATHQESTACDSITTCQSDTINPVAVCKDIIIMLNGGSASIAPNDINDGSSDNCAIYDYLVDNSVFTTPGYQIVHLIVSDFNSHKDTCSSIVTVQTGIKELDYFSSSLMEAFPNPFNDRLNISYRLPVSCSVEITIFNLLGEEIKTLYTNNLQAGKYTQAYDVSTLESGSYIIRLKTSAGAINRQNIIKK